MSKRNSAGDPRLSFAKSEHTALSNLRQEELNGNVSETDHCQEECEWKY